MTDPHEDSTSGLSKGTGIDWQAFVEHQKVSCLAFSRANGVMDEEVFLDIFQEAFSNFWAYIAKQSEISKPDYVFRTIFKRRLVDHLRNRIRDRQVFSEGQDDIDKSAAIVPVESLTTLPEREQYIKWAEECIEEVLGEEEKQIIDDFYYKQKRIKKIKERLGKSEGAVQAIKSRALRKLKDCVKKKAGEL